MGETNSVVMMTVRLRTTIEKQCLQPQERKGNTEQSRKGKAKEEACGVGNSMMHKCGHRCTELETCPTLKRQS